MKHIILLLILFFIFTLNFILILILLLNPIKSNLDFTQNSIHPKISQHYSPASDQFPLKNACNFIKKTLQHRYSSANFAKLLSTPFYTEHLRAIASEGAFLQILLNFSEQPLYRAPLGSETNFLAGNVV